MKKDHLITPGDRSLISNIGSSTTFMYIDRCHRVQAATYVSLVSAIFLIIQVTGTHMHVKYDLVTSIVIVLCVLADLKIIRKIVKISP